MPLRFTDAALLVVRLVLDTSVFFEVERAFAAERVFGTVFLVVFLFIAIDFYVIDT
jgi:hypothetical protein